MAIPTIAHCIRGVLLPKNSSKFTRLFNTKLRNEMRKAMFNTLCISLKVKSLSVKIGNNQLNRYFTQNVTKTNINLSSDLLPSSSRRIRRRQIKEENLKDSQIKSFNVDAFSTAEEFNLEHLKLGIQQTGLYAIEPLPSDVDDVLYVTAKYRVTENLREIFFFREGTVIFWNVNDDERKSVFKFLKDFEINFYDTNLVKDEQEQIEFKYVNQPSQLIGDVIHLNIDSDCVQLEKYAFSNALSASVKLAIWEAALENYILSIEHILNDMKIGKKLKITREEQLQKTGQLYSLRHSINLSSDLLDTPDFYWDRSSLEKLYNRTCSYLNIAKRTKVMNEKLTHCSDLADLLINYLNDKHSTRLEWFIIWLIAIEVGFESFNLIEKYYL